MSANHVKLTVAGLKAQLAALPDDAELVFENGLTFYAITTRGNNLVQIEFNERFFVLDDY